MSNTKIKSTSRRRFTGFSAALLSAGLLELPAYAYVSADISIPAAVSVFPGENYEAPLSWAKRAYRDLIYYNRVEDGGHFAAWEQPQRFANEVRAGLRSLRV